MANRVFGALLLALFGCVQAAVAQSTPMRVLYAEQFAVQSLPAAAARKPGSQAMRLGAFNRTFDLRLEDNARLLRGAPASVLQGTGRAQLLQGTIDGAPGSWVRLTLVDGSYRGAIWDGSELYFVEPRSVIGPMLLSPFSGTASSSAIYRLSDTQGGVLEGTCAADASQGTQPGPLARYRKLVDELRSAASAQLAFSQREMEVSVVGDFEFTSALGPNAVGEMLSLMNVVDGIFNEQVGVAIIPTDFITFPSDTDPFTSSTASLLLNELGEYRNSTPAVRGRGLAHLLTRRDLDGDTIGIAFRGALCESTAGVGLSQATFGSASALIIAHEMGHNFGAPHDGEAGACAGTPGGQFLMSPTLNNSSTFSACSLQLMQPEIAGAACIVTARNRDVAIAAPAEVRGVVNQPFELAVNIASVGQASAVNVVVSTTVFAQSVSLPGAMCTSSQTGDISCVLQELPPGESRTLSMTLQRSLPMEFDVTVNVVSTNDSNPTNNSRTVRAIVGADRDFSVAIAPQPLTVTRGAPFEMTFDVTGTGALPLSNLTVDLDPVGTVNSASIDDGTCSITQVVACTIASLPVGVTRRLRVQMVSDVIGTRFGAVQVTDSGPGNIRRRVEYGVTTRPLRDIEVTTPPPTFRLVPIGTDALWDFQVRSNGAQPVDGVLLRLRTTADLSVDGPIASACTRAGNIVECDLGTVAAGAVLSVPVRVRSNVALNAEVVVEIVLPSPDEVPPNDGLNVGFNARVANDVAVDLFQPGTGTPIYDTRLATLRGSVDALGASSIAGVQVSISFPVGFSIASARVGTINCAINAPTPHLASCTVNLAPLEHQALTIDYVAPEPGVFVGTVSLASVGDANSSNNSESVSLTVLPNVNARLLAPEGRPFVRLDTPVDLVFTTVTNQYTLPDATFIFGDNNALSATVVGHTCTDLGNHFLCELGDLPPNTSLPITVRLQGTGTFPSTEWLYAAVNSPGETSSADNIVQIQIPVVAPADLGMPAQATGSAFDGQLTSIVVNVETLIPTVQEASIEVDVDPRRVQNFSVQGGVALCSNSIPKRCLLGAGVFVGQTQVHLGFAPVGTGPLTFTIRLSALNDFNPANDVQTLTVDVQAFPTPPPSNPPPSNPPPSPSSGGGGGGGGGQMGWLTLMLLLFFALYKSKAAAKKQRPGRARPFFILRVRVKPEPQSTLFLRSLLR